MGGSEHAVAHLLYARLWVKVLHDLGYLNFDEPFKKLINQGKITGDSRFVYRLNKLAFSADEKAKPITPEIFVSSSIAQSINGHNGQVTNNLSALYDQRFKELNQDKNTWAPGNTLQVTPLHVHIEIVEGLILNIDKFKKWKPDFVDAEFILEDAEGNPTSDLRIGKYICGSAIEKMSKSYFNVVNPDEIINNYGADTLRMYEMFLGPLEQSKPWNTNGIDGVFKFLRKFWNLFHEHQGNLKVSEAEPSREELKVLHKTLKKIEQDMESFSFNTSVSEFMICANELSSIKCNKKAILEPLVIALSPFAPHIAEELWEKLGHNETILNASFPSYNEEYLKESAFNYPISINGKVRAEMKFALDMPKEDIEKMVLASDIVMKWTEGKPPKKVIVVPGRIVNVVL